MIPEAMSAAGEQLKTIIKKQSSERKEKEAQFNTRPPAPILPLHVKKLPLEVQVFILKIFEAFLHIITLFPHFIYS